MKMKVSRKLAGSMIIAVICCIVFGPMKAVAEEKICLGLHDFITTDTEYSVTTTSHSYLCGTVEQEDGTEEYVYQDCTVTITIDKFEQECDDCGKVLPQQGS